MMGSGVEGGSSHCLGRGRWGERERYQKRLLLPPCLPSPYPGPSLQLPQPVTVSAGPLLLDFTPFLFTSRKPSKHLGSLWNAAWLQVSPLPSTASLVCCHSCLPSGRPPSLWQSHLPSKSHRAPLLENSGCWSTEA